MRGASRSLKKRAGQGRVRLSDRACGAVAGGGGGGGGGGRVRPLLLGGGGGGGLTDGWSLALEKRAARRRVRLSAKARGAVAGRGGGGGSGSLEKRPVRWRRGGGA